MIVVAFVVIVFLIFIQVLDVVIFVMLALLSCYCGGLFLLKLTLTFANSGLLPELCWDIIGGKK